MNQQDWGFDYQRYRKLLAEAVDEPKRLALINLLVDERARDKLAAQLSSAIIRGVLAPRGVQDDGRNEDMSEPTARAVKARLPAARIA